MVSAGPEEVREIQDPQCRLDKLLHGISDDLSTGNSRVVEDEAVVEDALDMLAEPEAYKTIEERVFQSDHTVFQSDHGREPTDDELAKILDMTVAKLRRVCTATKQSDAVPTETPRGFSSKIGGGANFYTRNG